MRRPRSPLKILLVLALIAVPVFLLVLPRVAGSIVRSKVLEIVEAHGLSATIGNLRLQGLSTAVVTDLCLQHPAPHEDADFVCFERVEVEIYRPSLTSTDVTVLGVQIDGGVVYADAEYGTPEQIIQRFVDVVLGDEDDEEPSPDEPTPVNEPADNQSDTPEIPQVQLTDIRVSVAGQGFPIQALVITTATVSPSRSGIDLISEFSVEGLDAPGLEDADVAGTIATVHIGNDGALTAANVTLPDGFEVDTAQLSPGSPSLTIALGGFAYDPPYGGSVSGLRVTADGQDEPVFQTTRLSLELDRLDPNLAELHIASLEIVDPAIYVTLDEDLAPTFLAALTEATDEPSRNEPANPDATTPATPSDIELAIESWLGRDWWNIAPWFVAISNGTIGVQLPESMGGAEVVIGELNVDYAVRILNLQLDVGLHAVIEVDGDSAGQLDADVVWSHGLGRMLRTDAVIAGLDVGALARAAGIDPAEMPLAGVVDLEGTWTEPERRVLQVEGVLALRDALLPVPMLSEPLPIEALTYQFAVESARLPWSAEPLDDDEEPEVHQVLRFRQGDITINDADLQFTATLIDPQMSAAFARHADIELEVPDQPAMTLFNAIPEFIRGPLNGTQMNGNYGLTLHFPVDIITDEDGEVDATVGEPTEYDVRDDSLQLASLPREVDVRRMNDAMSFTFRGPDDSVNRSIDIPAPAGDGGSGRGWARLSGISYYLIATQLYREDGSFFRNGGINWFQLRNVAGEAIEEQELGRGASTISMQLVKNVFLTHDRSLERKFRELFLTYWMTRVVPKDRILEIYLNIIEWGPGLNGVVEAADHYFGRQPDTLTLSEAVWLSAITPDPIDRSAQRNRGEVPDWMWRNCTRLMEGLHGRDWISSSELADGLRMRPRFVTSPGGAIDPTPPPPEPLDVFTLPPELLGAPAPPSGTLLGEPEQIAPDIGLTPEERRASMIGRASQPRGPGPAPRP